MTASPPRSRPGRRSSFNGWIWPATRWCSTLAAARGRSPRNWSAAFPTAPSMPSMRRRRWSSTRRQALGDRATILGQDLTELALPEPVDVVFSNATFHWIPDHDALFAALHRNMRPGGRLVAQCGGRGNIDSFRLAADEIAAQAPFAPHFKGWQRPWNYATAEETTERLQRAGFEDVSCWLEDRPIELAEPRQLHRDRVPGAPPRPAAAGAARPVRRPRAGPGRRAVGARLRPAQHGRPARLSPAQIGYRGEPPWPDE